MNKPNEYFITNIQLALLNQRQLFLVWIYIFLHKKVEFRQTLYGPNRIMHTGFVFSLKWSCSSWSPPGISGSVWDGSVSLLNVKSIVVDQKVFWGIKSDLIMYESVDVNPFLVMDYYNQSRGCLIPDKMPHPFSSSIRHQHWSGSNHCTCIFILNNTPACVCRGISMWFCLVYNL